MGEEKSVSRVLDVTGKLCPLPLIALAKEARKLAKGEQLRLVGDDPLFEESMADFCRERGHEILEVKHNGRRVEILMRI